MIGNMAAPMRLLTAILLLLVTTSPLAGALPMRLQDGHELPSLAPILEPILPAVVNISTRSRVLVRQSPLFDDPFFRRFFDLPAQPRERVAKSLGSGVVIDATHGYVITNHHVVDKADEITVTLHEGRVLQAEPVGTDKDTDIAVIKIPTEHLIAIPLGDSDRLRVGDFVTAIGNPFGLGQTVTSGIVSALGRSGLGIEGYEDFIQTDASINPGNSGGALVDLRGELVGVNTAILAPNGGNVGIGFAIPVNMVRQVVGQLTAHGKMRRGSLGIVLQDITPELASAFSISSHQGAVVAKVVANSSADEAGLRVGDVIVAINGRLVHSSRDLRNTFGVLSDGDKAELQMLRDGHPLRLTIKVSATRQETLAGERVDARLRGVLFGTIDENSRSFGKDGVVVLTIEAGSPAASIGLQVDDVLVAVNRRPVHGLADLPRSGGAKGNLLLNISRGDASFMILLQ